MSGSSASSAFKYRAFISYSHADGAWGTWLHRSLETWRAPAQLAGVQAAAGAIPRRLSPIFLDREELASATDLSRTVNEALTESETLIVICSPRSAQSRWVNEEVLAFKRMRRGERVFCLVVDGEPNTTDIAGREAEECFCPALRHRVDASGELTGERIEPVAADVRRGKDGKANARLKLIAGILGVGFDKLKHRELQRHTRRLAAIAAAGLVGMAIMATLAAIAVHERKNAVMQRGQAEELVGYMLGDLRTNLDAAGKLDLLDGVADHASRYFDAQSDPGDTESRAKRANALLLVGRVRLAQGKVEEATHAFNESLRFSQAGGEHGEQLAALQLAVIDGKFWLGNVAWQRGNTRQALVHFGAALPLVTTLIARHPDDTDAQQRLAWMHSNIGHVYEAEGAWSKAMAEYTAELQVSQRLSSQHPHDRRFQIELATSNDNIAGLFKAHGQFEQAERYYIAERATFTRLMNDNPRDSEVASMLAIAQTYLAEVAESLGHTDMARDDLRQAKSIGERALAGDAHNIDRLADLASYCRRLARNVRLTASPSEAGPLLDRASALYARALSLSPNDMRGQFGLAATRLEQAQLAWQAGDAPTARRRSADARNAFATLHDAKTYERDVRIGVATALLLEGKLHAAAGAPAHARARWSEALAALHGLGNDPQDADQLSVRAELLTRLGRNEDAQRLITRLDAMHYRDPAFVAWRYAGDAVATP